MLSPAARSRIRRSDEGFTLVELLVVMVIMAVIGGVATAGITGAFSATRTTQARIDALSELQRGAERISRELRAACPVDDSVPMVHDEVAVVVFRGGERLRHHFWHDTGSVMHHVEVDDGSGNWVEHRPAQALVTDVEYTHDPANPDPDAPPLFRYLDEEEDPVTAHSQARAIRITLVRDLPEQDPLRVETAVQLRNGGLPCG